MNLFQYRGIYHIHSLSQIMLSNRVNHISHIPVKMLINFLRNFSSPFLFLSCHRSIQLQQLLIHLLLFLPSFQFLNLLPHQDSNLDLNLQGVTCLLSYKSQGNVCCLRGFRTPTLLLQRQTCYQLHHKTIFERTLLKQKTRKTFGFRVYILVKSYFYLYIDKTLRLNIPFPLGRRCLPCA